MWIAPPRAGPAVVASMQRPVPLHYSWAVTPMHEVSWMAFDQVWLAVNAAVSAWLAHAVLRK